MIEGLLPRDVVFVGSSGNDPSASLHPEEAAELGWAVDRRVTEFANSRTCARRALLQLGIPPVPVLRGTHGEPLWPCGVVGSITHCDGYCAVAVAWKRDFLTLGIDAELHAALPRDVLEHVCVDQELTWLKQAPRGIHWDCLFFSVKEAVFKAWFPLTGRWLGFEDVCVTFDTENCAFRADLLRGPLIVNGRCLDGFSGRFEVRSGLVLSAVALQSESHRHHEDRCELRPLKASTGAV